MLKIAIVVQGRFHGFDLARELLARGHDVTLFTNYPGWAVGRFGVPRARTQRLVSHGVVARVCGRIARTGLVGMPEAALHRWFGRWAERRLRQGSWDVIHVWSGIAEEAFRSTRVRARCRLLMRGSAHIKTQARLLAEEERRAGVAIDRPSAWMVAREGREYDLADHILVLSTFAQRSFEEEGVPSRRLSMVRLGVNVDQFRPAAGVLAARRRRLLEGQPLRILYVGALSYQKGLLEVMHAVRTLGPEAGFQFTLVGSVLPEAQRALGQLGSLARVVGKVPQSALPAYYWDADVFLYPTIQDGYAAVTAQAKAAALPILTTAHGAGLDIVTPDQDGWIVPIRDADAIVSRLRWCDANRPALAAMGTAIAETFHARDWADVARDFESVAVRLAGADVPDGRPRGR